MTGADEDPEVDSPIDGQVVVLTAAKASVPPSRLPELLSAVQADLGPRIETYRERYERVAGTDGAALFFVDEDHWPAVGDRLGLGRRETDAVRRAHNEQLRRFGLSAGRREEIETALEIRDGAVVGT